MALKRAVSTSCHTCHDHAYEVVEALGDGVLVNACVRYNVSGRKTDVPDSQSL